MTIVVDITISDGETRLQESITVDTVAENAVRFKFNPSGLKNVAVIKALAAALYQAINNTAEGQPQREIDAGQGRYHARSASMWGVSAATEGL